MAIRALKAQNEIQKQIALKQTDEEKLISDEIVILTSPAIEHNVQQSSPQTLKKGLANSTDYKSIWMKS